ncbi:MAG: S8 family serine peptidase, partial [Sedimentisphaerales bacterium]
IRDCSVQNASGGAIYISSASNPEFRNVNITNCSVTINGGGVYISSNSNPIFRDCSIADCEAGINGGAVYCRTLSDPQFINCSFANNYAADSAGAIFYETLCNIVLEGCELSGNTAPGSAGAVMCSTACVVEVNNCNFSGNEADYAGGIYLAENCDGRIHNTSMASNTATEDGGAIYIIDSNAIEITDCNITANIALHGGGIFALESPKVNITNCQINSNESYKLVTYYTNPNDPNTLVQNDDFVAEGGGIYAFASIKKVADCQITGNTARTSGGGIYISGDQEDANYPLIKNCLIANNKSNRDGGGISTDWFATATIQNCTIAENYATNANGLGGGLYCSYASDTLVKDTIFWANSGIDGSQIAVGSGDLPYPLPAFVNITYSDIDLREGTDFNSLVLEDSTGTGTTTGVLVDSQTINNEIAASGTAKVIVSLTEPAGAQTTNWSSPASVSSLRSQIATLQNQVLSTFSTGEFTLRQKLTNAAIFSGQVTQAGLNKLMSNPSVAHIEPVRTVHPMLAQAIPLANALATRPVYNGSGISIAIVDTGIDYTHPRLGGGGFPNSKVIGGYDTADNDADPIPGGSTLHTGHGTCCAGIAAGLLGTVGDYIGGVAYNAKLYALKASSNSSDGLSNDATLAAWDWCITHQNDNPANPISIMSNSWGFYNLPFNNAAEADAFSPAHTTAAQTAVNAGITILAASGNDGFAGQGISWPSAMSNVISVGAVYDTTDRVTGYSNTANILDILAPADPVYTTDIVGAGGYNPGDYFPSFNGTSSACPFAAGSVAALQSAAKQLRGKHLTPSQVRTILRMTGDPVTDTKVAITKPRVNVGTAIALLSGSMPIYREDGCMIIGLAQDSNGTWVINDNHNISPDPNFVLGFYLSHTGAMQDFNSPCFDIGSDTAANLGLSNYTTRTDGVKDSGIVDLGYHYYSGVPSYTLQVAVDCNDANGTIESPYIPGHTYNLYAGAAVRLHAIP